MLNLSTNNAGASESLRWKLEENQSVSVRTIDMTRNDGGLAGEGERDSHQATAFLQKNLALERRLNT